MRNPFKGQWYGRVERVLDVFFHCANPAGLAHHRQFQRSRTKGGNDNHFPPPPPPPPPSSSKSMDNIIFTFFFFLTELFENLWVCWRWAAPESAAQAFLLNNTSCFGALAVLGFSFLSFFNFLILFLKNLYLFTWLRWVLVAASGLLSCSMRTLLRHACGI